MRRIDDFTPTFFILRLPHDSYTCKRTRSSLTNLAQPLYQPPLPPPPHRKHEIPPIIPNLLPIRIPHHPRKAPEKSSQPRSACHENSTNGCERVGKYQDGYAAFAVEGVGIGVEGGENETELKFGCRVEEVVEAGAEGVLFCTEADWSGEEEDDGDEDGVDGYGEGEERRES